MRTQFLHDVLFPALRQASGGGISIAEYWNGSVAAPYDALASVAQAGGADLATTVPEYTAAQPPLQQIFKSFPVGPKGADQVEFFRRAYREIPAFEQEMQANNLVTLFLATGYPVAFFSTKPMADLRDLTGGRWRSASFWHLDALANAGATPVRLPWGPQIPRALAAGELDGLMVNVDSG